MKRLLFFLCCTLVISFNSYAKKSNDYIVYLHHDANDTDHYSSIGVEIIHRKMGSNLGFSLTSSLGYARVNDTFDHQHGFIALEGGVKFGYFADFSLYTEFGVDLLELAFNDRSDHEYSHNHAYNSDFENDNFGHEDYDNDIDGYIGIGSSITVEQIKITGFIRLREISGYDWQAKNNTFSGIELAIVF